MMIDFALVAERQDGMTPEEAIYQACRLRFRPIMMTTMAALLGAVPLAFSGGSGSELRRPLGIAIIGGLLISQLLTLYTTPVILYLVRSSGARGSGGRRPCRDEHLRTVHPGSRSPRRLLVVAITLAGSVAVSAAAGIAAAESGVPDHLRQRAPSGASRRDHGLVGRHTARAPVRTHRGGQRDELVRVALSSTSVTLPIRPGSGHRTPPPATCRRRSTRPGAICPPACPTTLPTGR